MSEIFVDADGCPVKDEVYRVARRYGLTVHVVANGPLRVPEDARIRRVVVSGLFDAADDWIVGHARADDIVITADIPLAGRCLEAGAHVLGPRGRPFTPDNIGDARAGRDLNDQLRQLGLIGGGPPPFAPKDRSRFLGALDALVQAIRRK